MKWLDRLALLMLALWQAHCGIGQGHAWVYHPDLPHMVGSTHTAPLADGGVLSCGISSIDTSLSLNRLDVAGEIVWLKALRIPDLEVSISPKACIELFNGDLMLLAQPVPTAEWHYDLLLIRTEASGQPLWAKRLTLPDSDFGIIDRSALGALSDGSLMVYVDQGESYVITRIDPQGNIVWSRRYEHEQLSTWTGNKVMFHSDDECILVVRNGGLGSTREVVATRLGLSGEVQWSRKYFFGEGTIAYALGKEPSGTFLIAGKTAELAPTHTFVLRIEPDGDPVWRRNYWHPGAWLPYVDQVVPITDSGFIIRSGSYIIHAAENGELASAIRSADDSLASIWVNIVQAGNDRLRLRGGAIYNLAGWGVWGRSLDMVIPLDEGADCSLEPSPMLSASGMIDSIGVSSTSSSEVNVSIVGLDINATTLSATRQALCDFANHVVEDYGNSSSELVITPNPAHGSCVLRSLHPTHVDHQVTVRDDLGRLILTERIPMGFSEFPIDLRGCSPGLYVVSVVAGGKHHSIKTMVE